MQRPLQITFRGMGQSDAIEDHLRRSAAELEQYYENVTGCHVTVEAPHQHQHKGHLYSVRVDIRLPSGEVVANRTGRRDHAHEDIHVAIRDAFAAAVRQLEDYARRRRGQVKRHAVPAHGRVARLLPGEQCGFIERSDGLEVYFHAHSVVGQGYPALEVGDEVRLELAEGEGEDGPQASAVIPVGKHHIVGPAKA